MEETLLKLLMSGDKEKIVSDFVGEYKPALYQFGREILIMMKDYANNKEVFEVSATLKRNQFDAYIAAGFTEDQAIAFILNDNLKLMKQIEKTNTKSSKSSK